MCGGNFEGGDNRNSCTSVWPVEKRGPTLARGEVDPGGGGGGGEEEKKGGGKVTQMANSDGEGRRIHQTERGRDVTPRVLCAS